MAERRMFTQKITESDAFLDMPASSQALYFHLCMNADDDGFVSKPKSIMRSVGAKDDDIKLLSIKKFIIPFENGVIVIKHWRMHNLLRKDRYTETAYKELKGTLYIDENGSYSQTEQIVLDEQKKPLTPAQQKRLDAKKNSDLPYSFEYKIRSAFIGEICPICGVHMGVATRSDDDPVIGTTPIPTIQHNIPISKGGTHTLDNISVICQSCNYSIQDKETGKLNNDLVVKKWKEIENGSGMATKYSIELGKDSIDKNNNIMCEQVARKKFQKPTFEEVDAYCKERNNGIDAEAFIAFYESKGWLIGKVPMKSWKSAIITWEKSRKQTQVVSQVKKYNDVGDMYGE